MASIDDGEIANVKDLPWIASGICVVKMPSEKLFVISGNGMVFTYVGGKSGDERIADALDLQACIAIDDHAFACGIHRQLYCRDCEGNWNALYAPAPRRKDVVIGFEAVGGFNRKDIYAAGWQGEIWHFDGSK